MKHLYTKINLLQEKVSPIAIATITVVVAFNMVLFGLIMIGGLL